MKTTLIAATLNEIEAVTVVLPQIDRNLVDEVLIADGGSTDGTVEFCQTQGCTIVHSPGRGYGAGVNRAVGLAKGDFIIEFPPDGNSLADRIPALLERLGQGYDFVIVSRYKNGAKSYDDDFMTAIGNRMFTFLTNQMFGTQYTDVLVGYRGYRKAAFNVLQMDVEGLSWPAQQAIRFALGGFRVGEIPGDEPKRIGGQRKMRIFKTGLEICQVLIPEYVRMKKEMGRPR